MAIAAFGCTLALWILGDAPSHARGANEVTCRFDMTSGTVTVSGDARTVYARLGGGDEIIIGVYVPPQPDRFAAFQQAPCTDSAAPGVAVTPTLTNIDTIVFDTTGAVSNSLWQVDTFGPGRTTESGASEIETVIGASVNAVLLSFEAGERRVELGSVGDSPGIDLNAHEETSSEADPDLTFLAAPPADPNSTPVSISSRAPVRVDGTGQQPFDAPFPGGMNVHAEQGDDYLAAGTAASTLLAGGGSNTVIGSPGDDLLGSNGPATISAGSGDDRLIGGFGDSHLDGGPGSDLLSFAGWYPPGDSSRGVHFRLGVAEPQEIGLGVVVEASSAERYYGSSFNDRLVGTAGADVINGSRGYDRIFGRGGDDELKGSDGEDRLIGGAGRDRLRGNRDNDILDARDGERDLNIHCGQGDASHERALRDRRDPGSKSC